MKSQQKQELDGIIDKIIGYFRFHDRKERDDETDMWERINREIRQQEKKTRVREYIKRFLIPVSVAACLLLAYVIDKGEFSDNSWTLDAYVGQLADVAEASGQVQLLLSDKRKVQIDKDTVGIVYSSNGKIQIEQEEHTVSETSENTDEAKGFNQIIVPKGKYSQLTLSDGTRMHVNSGTRVVYPRVFADNRREIYVEGEIYLDVTPDKSRPFVVKTHQFNVEVLGTSFNVNAYKGKKQSEVVLVEGSVRLSDKYQKEVLMKPDNLVVVSEGRASRIKRVRAKDYTAWINGLLILHNEPLMSVFERLNRFYDVSIVVAPAIQTEIVDGKLDLRLPLSELVRMISVVVPIDCQIIDGTYYISPKRQQKKRMVPQIPSELKKGIITNYR